MPSVKNILLLPSCKRQLDVPEMICSQMHLKVFAIPFEHASESFISELDPSASQLFLAAASIVSLLMVQGPKQSRWLYWHRTCPELIQLVLRQLYWLPVRWPSRKHIRAWDHKRLQDCFWWFEPPRKLTFAGWAMLQGLEDKNISSRSWTLSLRFLKSSGMLFWMRCSCHTSLVIFCKGCQAYLNWNTNWHWFWCCGYNYLYCFSNELTTNMLVSDAILLC